MNADRLICLVTDRRRLAGGSPEAQLDAVVELVSAAVEAGVDLIQLRERDLGARDLAALTARCLARAAGSHSRIVVNERVDVALAAGANGVHLRSDSISALRVRTLFPRGTIVGRSVSSAGAAVAAGPDVDYLILGTMFPSVSKPDGHVLAGIGELTSAAAAVSVPVLGIGGITLENAGQVIRAGGRGVAAIGLFIPPADFDAFGHVSRVVGAIRRLFDTC